MRGIYFLQETQDLVKTQPPSSCPGVMEFLHHNNRHSASNLSASNLLQQVLKEELHIHIHLVQLQLQLSLHPLL